MIVTRIWKTAGGTRLYLFLTIKTGYTQTYVNGTMVNDSLTAASNFGNAGFTQVRLIAWSPSYDGDDRPIVYFDDVRVYEAEVYPENYSFNTPRW